MVLVTKLTTWQKIWAWIKKHWKVILSVLGALVGLFTLFSLRNRRGTPGTPEITPEILENERDIARLEGRREAISDRISRVDERISEVDGKLADETTKLRTQQDKDKGMTLDEKLARFKELGY